MEGLVDADHQRGDHDDEQVLLDRDTEEVDAGAQFDREHADRERVPVPDESDRVEDGHRFRRAAERVRPPEQRERGGTERDLAREIGVGSEDGADVRKHGPS